MESFRKILPTLAKKLTAPFAFLVILIWLVLRQENSGVYVNLIYDVGVLVVVGWIVIETVKAFRSRPPRPNDPSTSSVEQRAGGNGNNVQIGANSGTVIIHPPPASMEDKPRPKTFDEMREQYIASVFPDYLKVDYGGVKGFAPRLDDVYIPLRLKPISVFALHDFRDGEEAPLETPADLDLADAFSSNCITLLGAAGRGKSTTMKWIGLSMLKALKQPEALTPEQRKVVNAVSGSDMPALVPVAISLKDYVVDCVEHKTEITPKSLLEFGCKCLQNNHHELSKISNAFLETLLSPAQSGCIVLFDGFDEALEEKRGELNSAIERFVSDFSGNKRNRFVVASRDSAYRGKFILKDFEPYQIQPLADTERKRFVENWFRNNQRAENPDKSAQELEVEIKNSSNQVQLLASTPLMLAIACYLKNNRRKLPNSRAELYEQAIEVILDSLHHSDLTGLIGMTWTDKVKALMPIAYELQQSARNGLQETELIEKTSQYFGSRYADDSEENQEKEGKKDAENFIHQIGDQGDLLERRGNYYGFYSHSTFREYLAGRYIALEKQKEWDTLIRKYYRNDNWRETLTLAAGALSIVSESNLIDFIETIAKIGDSAALELAGDIILELPSRLAVRSKNDAESFLKDVMRRKMQDSRGAFEERRAIGIALGKLTARRARKPWEKERVEQDFAVVQEGSFMMGAPENTEKALQYEIAPGQVIRLKPWERPAHLVFLSEYKISKNLVTNLDFSFFVEEGGYALDSDFWSEEGVKWLKGSLEPDFSYLTGDTEREKEQLKSLLASRPPEKRRRPFFWDSPKWNQFSLPVVGVSWYEAEAYCNWLTQKMRAEGAITSEEEARLPTEAEWERAARAGNYNPHRKRFTVTGLWPWGDEVSDVNVCNNKGVNSMGVTTPVGMFPNGATKNGLFLNDMSGNVREWCFDWYSELEYSERKTEGKPVLNPRVEKNVKKRVVAKVMRGGSWDSDVANAEEGFINKPIVQCRATARDRHTPLDFHQTIGFRVTIAKKIAV
ncbi:MAG: SUMF1/EgtB/PvdO family nonheme iron enzyme [Chloroflexi bacterium]|nr:SUMF1/EgtB/PvdO family nonheme iron enzyme [Chloroflexota bacterium]